MNKKNVHLTEYALGVSDLDFAAVAAISWSTGRQSGVTGVIKFFDGRYIFWENKGGKVGARSGKANPKRGVKQLLMRLGEFN